MKRQQHLTKIGVEEDDDGFVSARCVCGVAVGPCPDVETLVDALMDHAYEAGAREVGS